MSVMGIWLVLANILVWGLMIIEHFEKEDK